MSEHVSSEPQLNVEHRSWLFSDESGIDARFIPDHERVRDVATACAVLGLKKVLTSGTFDILHEGHAEYLYAAKQLGDVLFVGVDSNQRTRQRKGPNRPINDEMERVNILSHLRSVDLVTLKYHDDEKMKLLKIVEPDVYVMSKSTYESEEEKVAMRKRINEAEAYCGEVQLLEPKSSTGTTARIRRLQLDGGRELAARITEFIQNELSDGHSSAS